MRNPLTRDRLNAAFPGQPALVRAFEEIAQITDETPDLVQEAQASATLATDAAAAARSTASRVAEGLETLIVQMLELRSERSQIAALTKRLDDLESTIYTERA